MPAEEMVLFLRLAPEFGGTRFGPFEGAEVRLGSDSSRNEITLPETLGVAAAHVKVLRNVDMGLIIAPVERTAAVYVWQGRATRPKQITTPVAVRSGDSFALVTAQGPRFFVEVDELPEELRAQRRAAGQNQLGGKLGKKLGRFGRIPGARYLTLDALKGEAFRQAFMRVLVTGPGQMVQRVYTFVVSGAIFMPRNMIMIAGIGGGWVMGAGAMCSRAGFQKEVEAKDDQVKNLQDQVVGLKDLSEKGPDKLKNTELTQQITGSTQLMTDLENDKKLAGMVWPEAQRLFQNNKDFQWLVNPGKRVRRASAFARFREGLEGEDMTVDFTQVLAFLAAVPNVSTDGWTALQDSSGEDVCGRGPLGLTYRQARNLSMMASLDHYYLGRFSDLEGEGSKAARKALLLETGSKALLTVEESDLALEGESDLQPIQGSSNEFCLHMEGGDDRESVNKLVQGVRRALGDKAKLVPDSAANYALTSRLAKFYAADVRKVNFTDRSNKNFDQSDGSPPGSSIENAWVLEQTAKTIARSIVLPCITVLNYGDSGALDNFGAHQPPPLYCLVMDWKLRNDGG